jgi:hypothetical protein
MGQVLAFVLLGNLDLCPCNDRASKRRAEEVAVFVDGVALNGREDELLDEDSLQIKDDHALSTESKGLLLNRSAILGVLLANVGKKADNLVALKYEPFQDD